jgi:hypothetical protein
MTTIEGRPALVAIDGFPVTLVALLRPETEALLPEAIRRIMDNSDPRGMLVVLVPPRPAPEHGDRDDGPVDSFVVSGPHAEALLCPGEAPERPLFDLLCHALESRIGGLEVLSGEVAEALPESPFTIEGILPHRGPDHFLRASAGSLLRQAGLTSLAIGFDQAAPEDVSSFGGPERVRLLAFHPEPVGPYVVRQHCALTSRCEVLAMQDSDDFSMASRLLRQALHLDRTGADIVGCHELRIDVRTGTVRAHRYPLDANAALSHRLGYVCLMGAMLVRTQTLRALGGFSTVRRIASDTQFLWRAHFSARIRNVDAFLYIRRIWQGSLTTAPETAIGVPERAQLRQAWQSAFDAVAAGRVNCSETALAADRRENDVLVTDLRTRLAQPAILS